MRDSNKIYEAIQNTKALVRTKENQIYKLNDKVTNLTNLWHKALQREQLQKDGILLTVVEVERELCSGFGGPFAQYSVRTKEGHSWIQMRKVKVGDKVLKSKSQLEATKRHIEELRKEGYNIRS